MNWQALGAFSNFGLLIIATISYLKPSVDRRISTLLFSVFILLLFLIIYRKIFRLIRRKNSDAVYLVKWGIKHWIENQATLKKLGYNQTDVESISDFEFFLYPSGESLNEHTPMCGK